MDMPVNVPIDDPNADTEWNDILRKHGIIPEKPPSPTPIIEEAFANARDRAHENRLDNKNLDQLDELEDDEDEEFLEQYRKQRMAELSAISRASVFNQVYPIQKPDYSRDVTDASNCAFVLVHLTSSLGTNTESRLLTELWRELARKYGDIKFCEMKADMCIEGYPDKNTPTILVYHDGDIKRQVITLRELAGLKTGIQDLEKLLIDVGALEGNDSRVLRLSPPSEDLSTASRKSIAPTSSAEDDDEWA
ncbi:MAG: hypothetical protein LQ337_004947 [Flavoplaca oasis]|nr:MAG: hypothetical protein LQ337_004947 [Flavoplaca oasis]